MSNLKVEFNFTTWNFNFTTLFSSVEEGEGEGVSLWTEGILPKWGWGRLFVNVENWKLKVENSVEAKIETWKLKLENSSCKVEFNFQIGHYWTFIPCLRSIFINSHIFMILCVFSKTVKHKVQWTVWLFEKNNYKPFLKYMYTKAYFNELKASLFRF